MDGESSEKNISRNSKVKNANRNSAIEIVALLGFGVFAALMKAYVKTPLNLPGHEWIIWMALLVVGRVLSPFKLAGSTMGVGASAVSLVPALGLAVPFFFFYFIIPAMVIDLAFVFLNLGERHWIFLIILSGLALALKAFVQWGAYLAAGMKYGAVLKHGFLYPIELHFAFGIAGGVIGVAIIQGIRVARKNRPA